MATKSSTLSRFPTKITMTANRHVEARELTSDEIAQQVNKFTLITAVVSVLSVVGTIVLLYARTL
jgi:hypothetical protein